MQNLDLLLKKKIKLLSKIKALNNFMRGTVYLSKRKCSNPNCKCHQDKNKLHKSFVLSFTADGKTHILSLRKEQADEIRKLTQNWKDLKELISKLTYINIQIIKLRKKINKNKDYEKQKKNK